MGKQALLTFFGLRLGSRVLLFFKQCISFPFVCLFLEDLLNTFSE